MTRIQTTLSFCICLLISSCSSIDSKDADTPSPSSDKTEIPEGSIDSKDADTPSPSSDKTEIPEGLKNLTEAQKRGMHLIKRRQEEKEFADNSHLTVHAGERFELTNKDGIHFNGAHVRSGSINTNLGSIIGMDDLIFYPKFAK